VSAPVEMSTAAAAAVRPLWQRVVELQHLLPLWPVASLPTPVELASTLGEELSIPGLFIKRDDLSSALYGGTKVRAAEMVLGAALRSGSKHLLCTSVTASNWLTVCTIYGKALAMNVHLLGLERPIDDNKKANVPIQAALADEVVTTANPLKLLGHLAQWYWRYRGDVLYAAPGGTSPATCLTYVNAMFELAEQIRAKRLPEPKYIFCGLGSCGTAAGLALGTVLAGLRSRIIATRIADRVVANRANLGRLIWCAMRWLQRADASLRVRENPLRRLYISHRYYGPGYGKTYDHAARMKQIMLSAVGIPLDDTYTAKTVWGMADFCRRNRIGNAPVLYWHSLNSQPVDLGQLRERVSDLANRWQTREGNDARTT